MKLSREEVEHIARLARLGLSEAEIEKLRLQLSNILENFEALKQILAHDPKAVIVMLTNQKEKYTVARIIDAGAKDYIIKPVSRRVILDKVRKLRASER